MAKSSIVIAATILHVVAAASGLAQIAQPSMVADIVPGPQSSRPTQFRVFGAAGGAGAGRLVFTAEDQPFNTEPWQSDGTAQSTRKIAELAPGPVGSFSTYWGDLGGGRLIFSGSYYQGASSLGQELLTTDLATGGASLVWEFCPGPCNGFPGPFATFTDSAGTFAVFVRGAGGPGATIWRTDGTPAGTLPLSTFGGPGTLTSDARTIFQQQLYFIASGGTSFPNGEELWRFDPLTPGSQPGRVWTPGSALVYGTFGQVFEWNGGLFAVATADGFPRNAVFRINTATTGAMLAFDPAGPDNSSPFMYPPPAGVNGRLFYWVYLLDDNFQPLGRTVWCVESPSAPPVQLISFPQVQPASGAIGFQNFTVARGGFGGGGRAFWTIEDVDGQTDLWTSDGTPSGTMVISRFQEAGRFLAVGEYVFFTAADTTRGGELWISDGTVRGTRPITDINPGPASGTTTLADPSLYPELAIVGNKLFFIADDGVHGFELWAWEHPLLDDCNSNAVADHLDLAAGALHDANHDAVPDECQCLANWDGEGSVPSVQDIFTFLDDYFAAAADANHDGMTSVQDIFSFLTLYFQGCP